MGRLRRFPDNRYLGNRDDMFVYDCDHDGQFTALETLADENGLVGANLLQAFGPDTVAEARNRGYRPAL
ncbi:hypothetical protein HQ535_07550 [bacterium]|nr:hypothetical protein [bacterium]